MDNFLLGGVIGVALTLILIQLSGVPINQPAKPTAADYGFRIVANAATPPSYKVEYCSEKEDGSCSWIEANFAMYGRIDEEWYETLKEARQAMKNWVEYAKSNTWTPVEEE